MGWGKIEDGGVRSEVDMDFRGMVRLGLEEYLSELKKALAGLSPEERRF